MSLRSTRMNKLPATNTAKSISQDKLCSDFKPESDASDPGFHAKVGRRNTTSTPKTVRKAPARRKRGKLRQMLDMPLDVILEICSHLLPRDLLNLARTSKALRSFFITRSAQSMWKAAFLNVPGLPSCPSDLSEPAYASLIFDAHCHGCWKKNCSNNRLHLELRTRLCETCMDGPGHRIVAIYTVPREHKFELSKIAGSHTLRDLLPAVYNSFFLETHIVELIKLLKEMPREEHAKFLEARQQSILELRSHAESLQGWLDKSTASRGEELRELKASRREAIIAKLQEDGWQGDLDYMKKDAGRHLRREFDNLPVVRKAQALTAKVWKNIKGPVTEFMQKVRETRIRAERKEILQRRLGEMREFANHLPLRIPGCSISLIEIALCVPETSRLIDPDNLTFNPEDLEVPIRNFLQQRSQKAREKLRQCVIRDYELDDSVDPFSLAVGSCFICWQNPCCSIMSLEQALNHRCYCGYNAMDKPEHVSDELYDLVRRRAEEPIWTTAWYSSIPEVMLKVVEACGLDPKTATVDALDRADVRLRCVCNAHRTTNWRPIMTWRVVAANCARDGGLCDEFVRATEAEIAATKPLEATALALRERQWDADVKFLCRHCTAVSAYMTKAQVVVHIRDSHGITDPSESDWIDTHTTLKVPSPVWLVSEKLRDEPSRFPTSDWFKQGVATYFQF